MTERLYYTDNALTEFTAQVVAVNDTGLRVELDRTAFYPESGGQPADRGTLNGIAVTELLDQDGSIVHVLASPFPGKPGDQAEGVIDRDRRFDHMQQHTGQHLLSAVIQELFGVGTVSFHMGAELSTIELACESFTPQMAQTAERRVLENVMARLPVTVRFLDSAEAEGLRKATERSGTLRIVEIEGVDRSACGGTHVGNTGEIGLVLIRGAEKIRSNVRIGFLCGFRALARTRQEFGTLSEASRALSCSPQDLPRAVRTIAERAAQAEKSLQRTQSELAELRGRELYGKTEPDETGLRIAVRRMNALDESARAEALAFTSGTRAACICLGCGEKTSLLICVSEDSGLHAGNLLKSVLTRLGGRGGGSARSAQCSFSSSAEAEAALTALQQELR